jgi:hypothetical protein
VQIFFRQTRADKRSRYFRFRSNYSILVLAMTKRKRSTFSATKAVKANARERVGQPKAARIVEDTPRTGRQAKYKPKLEQVIQREE